MHIDSTGLYDESSTLKYVQSIGERVEKTHLIQYDCYGVRKNLWNQISNWKQLLPNHNFAAVHLSNLYEVAYTVENFILTYHKEFRLQRMKPVPLDTAISLLSNFDLQSVPSSVDKTNDHILLYVSEFQTYQDK